MRGRSRVRRKEVDKKKPAQLPVVTHNFREQRNSLMAVAVRHTKVLEMRGYWAHPLTAR